MPGSVSSSSGLDGIGLQLLAQLAISTRTNWASALVSAPQTAVMIWRCVTTWPAWPARMRSSWYSRGVSRTSSPCDHHPPGREVDLQLAELEPGLGREPPLAPAQHRADPRQQLAHAHRLVDEVVGAQVQRGDLLALQVPRRQHDDRRVRPFADPLDHLLAVHVRQAEVEDDKSNPRHRSSRG